MVINIPFAIGDTVYIDRMCLTFVDCEICENGYLYNRSLGEQYCCPACN